MARLQLLLIFLITAFVGTFFLVGCDDDDDGTGPGNGEDMVTVTGLVYDIDRAVPAVGVRVKVYGTDYQMDVPTGDDGAFIIEVPRGTNFVTHTDDFDPNNDDNWFPLINSEVPGGLVINENTSGILIHACPSESYFDAGSLAAWNRQLGTCADPTRKVAPNVSSPEQSGGVLVLLVDHCEDTIDNTWSGVIDTRWSVDHPQVSPVGWARGEWLPGGDSCWWSDPSCADCILEPVNDGTNTGSLLGFAFADEDFAGGEVDVVFEELDATRGFTDGRFAVPLEPGAITLAWFQALEGEINSHWFDAVCGCNWEIPVSCD